MQFNIREHVTRVHVIEIQGRLEAFTVGALREEQARLLESGELHFIVDLSQTTFMDSAGLSALVSLLKRARQAGGDVVLIKPADPSASRILTLTRFDQIFLLAETVEDARRRLNL